MGEGSGGSSGGGATAAGPTALGEREREWIEDRFDEPNEQISFSLCHNLNKEFFLSVQLTPYTYVFLFAILSYVYTFHLHFCVGCI